MNFNAINKLFGDRRNGVRFFKSEGIPDVTYRGMLVRKRLSYKAVMLLIDEAYRQKKFLKSSDFYLTDKTNSKKQGK